MAINNTVKSSNPFADLFKGLASPPINTSSSGGISPFNLGGSTPKISPFNLGGSTPASTALASKLNTPAPVVKAPTTSKTTSIPASPKAPSVDMSGVPASAIAALNAGGLSGNDLAMAQKALADHYASAGASSGSNTGSSSSAPVSGLLTPPTPPSSGFSGSTTGTPTTPTYSGLVSTILDRASKSNQEVSDAFNNAATARDNLQKFRASVADATKGIYSAPTSARVMQGRDQALQVANASKEAALGSELTSAETAYNAALTGQGQQFNLLSSALNASQPTLGQYGQTFYNPLDPSSASSGANEIVTGWAQYLAGGGDPNQVPAAVSGNPVLWQQTLSAAKQQNPSFDVNTALGAAAGRQTNASTAGTAITSTAAQGYQTTTQNYNQMTAYNNAAHTQAGNLLNILNKTGINANNPTLFNKGVNTLQRNFSSTDYAAFTTALAELQNMYSQLLQTGGGTPSGNEQQALNVLNPNSSAAAIGAAVAQLEQAAYAKLQAQYNQANGYLQQLQGGGAGAGAGGGSTGGTISTSIGNFVKDASGKWVPAK